MKKFLLVVLLIIIVLLLINGINTPYRNPLIMSGAYVMRELGID